MPSDGEVQTLAPLTNDLIAHVLTARGYNFGTDDDGDIGGMWDDNLIWFFRRGSQGEMLQVRTLAAAEFSVDDVPRLYAFCNEWNHDRLWPKAFVHVNDDGTVRVFGEVTTDLERGVSHDQLDQLIGCGISTGCQLAEAAAGLKA
jgi:Putative bacterial sensory transduction regulator